MHACMHPHTIYKCIYARSHLHEYRVIKREGGTGIYIIRGARDKEEENEEGEWHGWVFTPKPRKYKPCTEGRRSMHIYIDCHACMPAWLN